MGVAGVAIGTVTSQLISCILVIRCLMTTESDYKLRIRDLRIRKYYLLQILSVGLPAGIQSTVINFSNVLLQSSVNSFGEIAMAGYTAANNILGFLYVSGNSITQACMSFTSQNFGAGKYNRMTKILCYCLGIVVFVGIVMGDGAVFFGRQLLEIYSSDQDVIGYGVARLRIICGTYFLCGIMDTMVGALRGIGYSVIPMFVSLTGACLFRVIWIYTIFAMNRTLDVLYYSYPVSWLITLTAHVITYVIIFRLRSRNQANVSGSSVAG